MWSIESGMSRESKYRISAVRTQDAPTVIRVSLLFSCSTSIRSSSVRRSGETE